MISSFLFYSFFGINLDSIKMTTKTLNDTPSASSRTKKGKYTKKAKLKSLGVDENVTVLHALGRVFNPKCEFLNRRFHCFSQ